MLSNYRPVYPTSICCKIMESVVKDTLVNYLERENLLTESQHGFRSKLSCCTQLLESKNFLTKCVDNGDSCDVIYTDFKKAFDSVSHPKLLHKLGAYGIQNRRYQWISGFFYGIGHRWSSQTVKVPSEVPQGSVLGHVLFLMYVNDIVDNLADFKLMALRKFVWLLEIDLEKIKYGQMFGYCFSLSPCELP